MPSVGLKKKEGDPNGWKKIAEIIFDEKVTLLEDIRANQAAMGELNKRYNALNDRAMLLTNRNAALEQKLQNLLETHHGEVEAEVEVGDEPEAPAAKRKAS